MKMVLETGAHIRSKEILLLGITFKSRAYAPNRQSMEYTVHARILKNQYTSVVFFSECKEVKAKALASLELLLTRQW
jgi:hypothetical protein